MKTFYSFIKGILSFIISAFVVILVFDAFSSSIFYGDSLESVSGSSALLITMGAPIFLLQLLTFILIGPLFITLLTPYVWFIIDIISGLYKKNREISFKNTLIQFWKLLLAFLISLSILVLLGRVFINTGSGGGFESIAGVIIIATLIFINFFLVFLYIGFYWILKKYTKGLTLMLASIFVFLVLGLTYINAIIPSIREAKEFLKQIEDRGNLNTEVNQAPPLSTNTL